MLRSSHIARLEEKKARKKIYTSLFFLTVIGVILVVWGLPFLTKFSLLLTSAGNTTSETTNQDTLPLLPPRFEPFPQATNSASITIRGFANPGEDVQLIVNGEEREKVLVGNDGQFTIFDVVLREGDNRILGKIVRGDKSSSLSQVIGVLYKKTAPKLEVLDPTEGQTFFGDTKNITLRGDTDPDNRVTINDRLSIVGSDGTFLATYPLTDGDNIFKVIASDAAGNQTTIERKVFYQP